jgi:hypothetical protein
MQSVSAGSILARSFKTYLQKVVPFTSISLVVHLPTLFALVAISQGDASSESLENHDRVSRLADVALGNIGAGAMTYGVVMQLRGQPVGVGRSLVVGLRAAAAGVGSRLHRRRGGVLGHRGPPRDWVHLQLHAVRRRASGGGRKARPVRRAQP